MMLGGAFFRNASASPGGGAGNDPYFSSVVLLLGFEGSNGSTTLTDESPAAHGTATANGNAQITTAQAAFGSSSGAFDGSGDYWTFPDSADWQLSTANSDQFTIEFWMMPHNNGGSIPYVIGQSPGVGNAAWYVDFNLQKPSFNFTANGSTIQSVASGANPTIGIDAWSFIAISKNSSGKIRLWRNGTLAGSATPADSSIFNSTGALEIGRSFATATYNGWLDEIRITKGVCRYDTDGSISVPTAAFPRS